LKVLPNLSLMLYNWMIAIVLYLVLASITRAVGSKCVGESF
jgi:hypothetical protein